MLLASWLRLSLAARDGFLYVMDMGCHIRESAWFTGTTNKRRGAARTAHGDHGDGHDAFTSEEIMPRSIDVA